jgi:hypothetical protein
MPSRYPGRVATVTVKVISEGWTGLTTAFVVKDPGVGAMTRTLAAICDDGHLADILSRLEESVG